jgi:ribonucleotide monophosphatase NagD (HAD superfamily)
MIRAVLLDLAGVVYQGEQPLPGAVQAIASLRNAGFRLRFLTNTTRMPRRGLLSRLKGMGIAIADDELFTPAQAARAWLAAKGLSAHLLTPSSPGGGLREPAGLGTRGCGGWRRR